MPPALCHHHSLLIYSTHFLQEKVVNVRMDASLTHIPHSTHLHHPRVRSKDSGESRATGMNYISQLNVTEMELTHFQVEPNLSQLDSVNSLRIEIQIK